MKRNLRFRSVASNSSLLAAAILLLAAAACAASPVNRPWVYADLRSLDKLDAPNPATEILAVYTRTTDLSIDIRVDLLDINLGDQYLIKLSFWDNRNFSQNPLGIAISSNGIARTSGIRPGMPAIWPRVIQNYSLDTITVNLNRSFIGERYRLDVSSYTMDPITLADEVTNIHSDGQPPVKRAPVLLAFMDTFPAATPAQALRRWDGAHTGPLGDRHGLLHILEGAGRYGIPVALLDVKNPASLAALSFMGNIPVLQDLYAKGLLILPDVAYGEPGQVALDFSRMVASGFSLPASQFSYAISPISPLPATSTRPDLEASAPTQVSPATLSGYQAVFLPLADTSHLGISGGIRMVPIPSPDAIEAGDSGPSLETRRALMRTALSPDPSDLVVLGGSLPHSTWGDADMAYPTFDWISNHPWIQALAGQDLLTFPAHPILVGSAAPAIDNLWLQKLQSAPQNIITRSAWQMYLSLTAPSADSRLLALGRAYLGQVGELLAAAGWAKDPAQLADCTKDLDNDGKVECILANQDTCAILEPAGARLLLLFHRDVGGLHQWVGPSSQFAVGLSDPSAWDPEKGEAADPNSLPGAFADDTGTWMDYSPTIHGDGITFTSPNESRVKTYRLTQNGIQLIYKVNEVVTTRIPLVVDPQAFYSGPTDYQATLALHSWTWGLAGGINVKVITEADLSGEGFISSIPFLSLPEDPNLGYPRGNYLPFPLSLVTVQSDGYFTIEIITNE